MASPQPPTHRALLSRALDLANRPFQSGNERRIEIVVLAVLLLLLTMNALPSFRSFFIGEDFGNWPLLQHPQPELIRTIFVPTTVFWRPVISLWFLVSAWLLPLNPALFHARNYVLTLACAALVYLILIRLTHSAVARLSGVALFVISKVHITTIGCIEMIDSIATLLHVLCAIYFLIVYLQSGRRMFFWFCAISYTLALYSRDYSLLLFVTIALLVFYEFKRAPHWSWRGYFRAVLPFAAITAIYVGTRVMVMRGVPSPSSGNYAMHFDVSRVVLHFGLFISDLFNTTVINPWIHGSGGLPELLGLPHAALWQIVFASCGFILLVVTLLARARNMGVWIFASFGLLFIGPTLLVEVTQTYYILVPLAACSIMLGLALEGTNRLGARLRTVWLVVLVAVFLNGWAIQRNWRSLWWATAATNVKASYAAMLVHERDPDLQRLTLMVADKDWVWYWKWLLDPFNGPGLVQTLTDNPTLHFTVEALDPQRVTAQSGARSAVYLERAGLLFKLLPLRISAGGPWTVRAGEPFNRQPGGESAIWLGTENILPTAVVKLGSATVPSAYAGPTGMSASIPGPLFDKSGVYPLYIEDPTTGMRSNVIDFRVTPRALTTLAPGVR